MSTDATLVELPPRIAKLDRDPKGRPIPYIVLRSADGTPNFTVNDVAGVLDCLTGGRCGICGEGLSENDVWFVGGPGSGLDPRGVYNDPPMHKECATYALRACPYLAMPSYRGRNAEAQQRVAQRLSKENPMRVFFDQTVDPARPTTFVLGKANGYLLSGYFPEALRVIPNRPFTEVEEWSDGQRRVSHRTRSEIMMLRKRGVAMLRAERLTFSHLSKVQKHVWNGKARGVFPWTDAGAFMEHVENTSRRPRL